LSLNSGGIVITNPWIYQSFVNIFAMLLLFLVVSNSKIEIYKTLEVICWCGFVMSLYVLIQALGFRQFFPLKTHINTIMEMLPSSQMTGTFGHPTLVSAFIAMCVPSALYLKRRWFAAVMIICVFLTMSQVSIVAMLVGLVIYFLSRFSTGKEMFAMITTCLIALVVLSYLLHWDTGRFAEWASIIEQIKQPLQGRYLALTGMGMGSFSYLRQGQSFMQAHNEYLEIIFNTGLIGLGLFIAMLWVFIRSTWKHVLDDQIRALLAMFICSLVLASGNFVWQIGTIAFYTVVVAGMIEGIKEK